MSYDELMYLLPKKRLMELRDARIKRLTEEQKSLEKEQEQQQREAVRQQIMQK